MDSKRLSYFFALTFINTYDPNVKLSMHNDSIKKYALALQEELETMKELNVEKTELHALLFYAGKEYDPNCTRVPFFSNSSEESFLEESKITVKECLFDFNHAAKSYTLSYYFYRFGGNFELLEPYWFFETGIQFSSKFWINLLEYTPELKNIIYSESYDKLELVKEVPLGPFFYIEDEDCQILYDNFHKLKGHPLELKYLKALLDGWKTEKFKIIFESSLIGR
jgi:hypothetical protein